MTPEASAIHAGVIEYAGIKIPTLEVTDANLDENPQSVREGRVGRHDRRVIKSISLDSFAGGLGVLIGSEDNHVDRYTQSDGLWAQRPGFLTLPPIINSASALITADYSAAASINDRPIHCDSAIGNSSGKRRHYTTDGKTKLIGPTSDTDPTPVVYHTFTNKITALAEITANGTRYLAIATDGTTNDVQVTADPTTGAADGTIDALSTLLALRSGDRIDVIKHFPQWGKTLLIGKYGGVTGAWFLDEDDALATAPRPAVETTTRDETPVLGQLMASSVLIAGAGTSEGGGDVAWSNPSNITADDGSMATVPFASVATSSEWLKAATFDFSGDSIPSSAIIEGFVVGLDAGTGWGGNDSRILEIQIRRSGTQIGVSKFSAVTASVLNVIGGLQDSWGPTSLTGADITGLEVWLRVGTRSTVDPQLDYVSLQLGYRESGVARTWVGPRRPTLFDQENGTTAFGWVNPENAWEDDGTNAFGSTTVTGDLWGGFWQEADVPSTTPVEEIIFVIQRQQIDAADDVADAVAQLWLDGQALGASRAITSEWGAGTDEVQTISYRFSKDPTITTANQVLGADLPNIYFNYEQSVADGTGRRIDLLAAYVSYRAVGTQQQFSLGAEFIGDDPYRAGTFYVLEPAVDDSGGRYSPRTLKRVTVSYATDGDRLLISVDPLPQPFVYATKASVRENFLEVAGSQSSGPARTLARLNLFSSVFEPVADVRGDLGMEAIEITGDQGLPEAWGIYDVFAYGDCTGMTFVNDANTILQDHIFDHKSGALHPIGPRLTINRAPLIPKGQTVVGAELRRRYIHVPNSTTSLNVHWQYTVDDVHADPFAVLASYDKQDGPLTITTPEFIDAFGDLPISKALLKAYCYSRRLSSTSTVKLEYSIDGGTNWVTWGSTGIFDTFGESIELATPVAFQTLKLRLTLDRGSTATDNVSGLPIVIMATAALPVARRFRVVVDVDREGFEGMENLRKRIKAAHDTLIVRSLKIGTDEAMLGMWDDNEGNREPTKLDARSLNRSQTLYFDEVVA